MGSRIWVFVVEVVSHWQGYVTGGFVTGLIGVVERLTNWHMPKWAYAAIFLGVFLLVSFFLAWNDQYDQAIKVPVLESRVIDREKMIDDLKQRPPSIVVESKIDPSVIMAALVAVDAREKKTSPQSPLKSRVLLLSKKILNFALERSRLAPPLKGMPITEEESYKQWQEQVRVSQESEGEYAAKFGPEIAAVFQALKANGIDINNWDWKCGSMFSGGSSMTMQDCGTQLGAFADQLP